MAQLAELLIAVPRGVRRPLGRGGRSVRRRPDARARRLGRAARRARHRDRSRAAPGARRRSRTSVPRSSWSARRAWRRCRHPAARRAVVDGDHNYFTVARGAADRRRARAGGRSAAVALPRRLLAARPPRRLLRLRADPRGVPPSGRGRRGRDHARRARPAPAAACRTRARPRARAARATACSPPSRTSSRRATTSGSPSSRRSSGSAPSGTRAAPWADERGRDPRPVGSQPAARAARGQPRPSSRPRPRAARRAVAAAGAPSASGGAAAADAGVERVRRRRAAVAAAHARWRSPPVSRSSPGDEIRRALGGLGLGASAPQPLHGVGAQRG